MIQKSAANQATNRPGFLIYTGRVVDAETHQPIPQIYSDAEASLRARTYLTWPKEQTGSGRKWSLSSREWETRAGKLVIKVEAPGYRPELHMPHELHFPITGQMAWYLWHDFGLHKGEGFSGLVMGPDGRPVVGAQVVYDLRFARFHLTGEEANNSDLGVFMFFEPDGRPNTAGIMIRPWKREPLIYPRSCGHPDVPLMRKGHFSMPGVPGIISLIVVHDRGYAQIPRETLDRARVIHLHPWTNAANAALQPGFKVDLKPNKRTWRADEVPQFTADIRNEGAANLLSSTNANFGERKWTANGMQNRRRPVHGLSSARGKSSPGSRIPLKSGQGKTGSIETGPRRSARNLGTFARPLSDAMYGQSDVWSAFPNGPPLSLPVRKHRHPAGGFRN